jgi:hypothetical protein
MAMNMASPLNRTRPATSRGRKTWSTLLTTAAPHTASTIAFGYAPVAIRYTVPGTQTAVVPATGTMPA